MADEKEVKVKVSSRKEGTGFEDTATAAKGTGEAVAGAGRAADSASTSFRDLAASLGLLLGIAEVISFLKDSTEAFYQNEKAVRGVGVAAAAYGLEVEKTKKETQEWADAMGRASGIANDELTRAVGEQLMLTGNLKDSYHAVSLAMDYATATGAKFSDGMNIVTAVIHGKTRSLVGAIPGITRHTEASEAQAIGQKFLEEKIRGATAATSDSALEADRAKERWAQFKETIGGVVTQAIIGVRDAITSIPAGLRQMGAAFGTVWAEISERGTVVATFLKNVWTGPAAAYKAYTDGMALASLHSQERMVVAQKAAVAAETQKQAALNDIAKQGAGGRLHLDDLTAKAEQKITGTSNAWQVAAWNASIKTREDAYKKYVDFVRAQQEQMVKDTQTKLQKEEDAELRAFEKTKTQVREIVALKKAAAKKEIEMQVAIANSAVELGGALFGESKELAIAQAIINTYQGATQALAQGGIYGIVLAAIVIAAGLAQVAKIESTEPATGGVGAGGAGFDDPSNDRAAYQGGRKWAGDMIREFSGGASSVSQGWSAGMGGSTTNNNSQTTNYNISGGLIDPNSREWMKQFARKLDLVRQADQQRTVARKT